MVRGLTYIQVFLWLADNVGMFYPKKTKVFQALIPIGPLENVDAASTYLFKSPFTFHIHEM